MKILPAEWNARNTMIGFSQDSDGRYVKLIVPEDIDFDEIDEWIAMETEKLWREKYEETVTAEGTYFDWADQVEAGRFPYEGSIALTPEEEQAIRNLNDAGAGLTMDRLWLFIEHLEWRPGMMRHGRMPAQAEVAELYQWLPASDDPAGLLLTGFAYLLCEVEGREPAEPPVLPVSYDLSESCAHCHKPLRFVFSHIECAPDMNSFRCGEEGCCL